MAPSELASINASVSTTEISVMTGTTYSSGSPQTGGYTIQCWFDLVNLTATETYIITVYEKVVSGGTQRVAYRAVVIGGQTRFLILPALMVLHGWDVTVLKSAGTDRTIIGSVRAV